MYITQDTDDISSVERVKGELQGFYRNNPQIKESHGFSHAIAVYQHAECAVKACSPPLSSHLIAEIAIAALLHDVDDEKYFPPKSISCRLPNATAIMENVRVPRMHWDTICFMIDQVSCSNNGNRIPDRIEKSGHYHLLIPRWADRVEAVGAKGALRCFQYTREQQRPLWGPRSPRPQTEEEIWTLATPDRFQTYQDRSGTSDDMISHYYDKLLVSDCVWQNLSIGMFRERLIITNFGMECLAAYCAAPRQPCSE